MLWSERHAGAALAYVAATLGITFGAAILGRALAIALTKPAGA